MQARPLALAALLACTACAPTHYLACPSNLQLCGKANDPQENAHKDFGNSIQGRAYDADGIKDGDHGIPARDGHGTYEHKGKDGDEAGDNGGGSTEH